MPAYNAQKKFRWIRDTPAVITVKITSGTLLVEKRAGADWVTATTISETSSNALWLGNGTFRCTPTGSCVYEVD